MLEIIEITQGNPVLGATAGRYDDSSLQQSYKHVHPKDMEGPVPWPTAAHPDDHFVRHSYKHVNPKDMEGPVL